MRCHFPYEPDIGSRNRAFSLVELMISVGIFLLVSASTFVLFSQQQKGANQQEGLVGLNIGMRNAIAQLQLDVANAGSGNYPGYNIPTWPIGVTIVNNVTPAGTSCYNAATGTYGVNCFDQLNILKPDPNAPPLSPTDQTGLTGALNCSSTFASGGGTMTAYGVPISGQSLMVTAGSYHQGDQLLFLSSKGTKLTSVVLTQAPSVYNNPSSGLPVAVQFSFNATNSDGSNTTGANFNIGSTTVPNDPLDIAACGGYPCPTTVPTGSPRNQPQAAYLADTYCGGDWMFRLAPIIYYVNGSNPSNPQLMRQQGGNSAVAVMDQVIGFKVGASIWNSANSNYSWGSSYYFYDASTYNINSQINPATGVAYTPDSPYLFPFIRSVRVSLIGRTQPSTDPSFAFGNAFDGGHYLVQGAAVVVSPRNLSMND